MFTPQQRWPVTSFALALIFTQPFFSVAHYGWNEQMGAYPANRSSIGIPIAEDLIAWAIFTPISLLGLWWALVKYPGSISLWEWNRQRQLWSAFWSFIFSMLLLCVLLEVPSDVRWLNPFSLLNDGLWFLLFCQLRALAVMKRGWI